MTFVVSMHTLAYSKEADITSLSSAIQLLSYWREGMGYCWKNNEPDKYWVC
jgi:hypothetical protein